MRPESGLGLVPPWHEETFRRVYICRSVPAWTVGPHVLHLPRVWSIAVMNGAAHEAGGLAGVLVHSHLPESSTTYKLRVSICDKAYHNDQSISDIMNTFGQSGHLLYTQVKIRTWLSSENAIYERGVRPGKHIFVVHAVSNTVPEALLNMLSEVVSIWISLTVSHQEQHPEEADINCKRNSCLTLSGFSVKHCITNQHFLLRISLMSAKTFCSLIMLFLIFSISEGGGG